MLSAGVYNELDSAAVGALVGVAAPTLAQHWDEMTKVIQPWDLNNLRTGNKGRALSSAYTQAVPLML